jgi:hypothetical protein
VKVPVTFRQHFTVTVSANFWRSDREMEAQNFTASNCARMNRSTHFFSTAAAATCCTMLPFFWCRPISARNHPLVATTTATVVCLALKRPRSKTTTRVKKLHNTQRIKNVNMVVVTVEFSQNARDTSPSKKRSVFFQPRRHPTCCK